MITCYNHQLINSSLLYISFFVVHFLAWITKYNKAKSSLYRLSNPNFIKGWSCINRFFILLPCKTFSSKRISTLFAFFSFSYFVWLTATNRLQSIQSICIYTNDHSILVNSCVCYVITIKNVFLCFSFTSSRTIRNLYSIWWFFA